MEQSREVYETATNQLGSFLELVSSRLTMNKSGTGLELIGTPLPPTSLSQDKTAISSSRRARSSSGARSKRSESENRRKSSLVTFSHRNRYHVENPSLSPGSISGTSSSPSSEGDPRHSRRSSDKLNYSRDVGSDISAGDNVPTTDDGAYNDISILSSCTCNDETDTVQNPDNTRKSSKTRNTLKRITSFMRKDKSKNLSLVNTGTGPASLKYSR